MSSMKFFPMNYACSSCVSPVRKNCVPLACGFVSRPSNVPPVKINNRRRDNNNKMKSFFCRIPVSNKHSESESDVPVESVEGAGNNEDVKISFLEKLAAKCVASDRESHKSSNVEVSRRVPHNVEISDSAIENIMIADESRKLTSASECRNSCSEFIPPFFFESLVDEVIFDESICGELSFI